MGSKINNTRNSSFSFLRFVARTAQSRTTRTWTGRVFISLGKCETDCLENLYSDTQVGTGQQRVSRPTDAVFPATNQVRIRRYVACLL